MTFPRLLAASLALFPTSIALAQSAPPSAREVAAMLHWGRFCEERGLSGYPGEMKVLAETMMDNSERAFAPLVQEVTLMLESKGRRGSHLRYDRATDNLSERGGLPDKSECEVIRGWNRRTAADLSRAARLRARAQ